MMWFLKIHLFIIIRFRLICYSSRCYQGCFHSLSNIIYNRKFYQGNRKSLTTFVWLRSGIQINLIFNNDIDIDIAIFEKPILILILAISIYCCNILLSNILICIPAFQCATTSDRINRSDCRATETIPYFIICFKNDSFFVASLYQGYKSIYC